MKRAIIVLMFFPICIFAQNKDYIELRNGIYINCNINRIDTNYIFYLNEKGNKPDSIKIKKVADLYIFDSTKKCKLLPLKCGFKNPNLPFKTDNQIKEVTFDLYYPKPNNLQDSIILNIKYTKYCLRRFHIEFKSGTICNIIGILFIGGGIAGSLNDKDNNMWYLAEGVGGFFSLFGTVLTIDSFKWIGRAGIQPILIPNGVGVAIKF